MNATADLLTADDGRADAGRLLLDGEPAAGTAEVGRLVAADVGLLLARLVDATLSAGVDGPLPSLIRAALI